MRPTWPLFMALLLYGTTLTASAAEGPEQGNPATSAPALDLLPLPASIKPGEGRFELIAKTVVVTQAGARAEAERLAAALRVPTGFELPVTEDQPSADCIVLEIDPGLESALGPEGYRLSDAYPMGHGGRIVRHLHLRTQSLLLQG